MGSFSIWHWFVILIFVFGWAVPLWLFVKKAGHHPALSLLLHVPLLNMAVMWFLAVSKPRSGQ